MGIKQHHVFKKAFLLGLIFFISSTAVFSEGPSKQKGLFPLLQPGRPVDGTIRVTKGSATAYQTYRFFVPDTAFGVKITLSSEYADLDLFVQPDFPIESYENAPYGIPSDKFSETLTINRFSPEPLKTGAYYVDATYLLSEMPVVKGRPVSEIPFTISLEIQDLGGSADLAPGVAVPFELTKDGEYLQVFQVRVPEGSKALRVDLTRAHGDFDLTAIPPGVNFDSDKIVIAETLAGRESLVIESPVAAGLWRIAVRDLEGGEGAKAGEILVSLAPGVPAELMALPALPNPNAGLEMVLRATVAVITESGTGSGTIVRPDGLILTNYHVIEDESGLPADRVIIALNQDSALPPEESFRGSVIHSDKTRDLALIQIDQGFYGQVIPDGLVFPYVGVDFSTPLSIGQPLMFAGYPGIGGLGSRTSITLTRGIVSGFDYDEAGMVVKTDGLISSGNSGGAALNVFYELVGVPTFVLGEDAAQLAYLVPVSNIPEAWRTLIRG